MYSFKVFLHLLKTTIISRMFLASYESIPLACLSVSIQLIFCFQGFHDHKFCMNAFAQVTSQEEKLIVKTEMKFCSYNAVQMVNTFTILIWKLERIAIQHLADFCLVCVLYWKQWFWWLQKALSDFLWQKFWKTLKEYTLTKH